MPPVNVPAAAVTVMSSEPLNDVPLIVLEVVNVAADVAVEALPCNDPVNPPDAVNDPVISELPLELKPFFITNFDNVGIMFMF